METSQALQDRADAPSATLTLAPKLDTAASQTLASELGALVGRDVTLDASQIEHLGAQGAQTLLSAARSWADADARLSMDTLSDAARDHLAVMGIAPETLTGGDPA